MGRMFQPSLIKDFSNNTKRPQCFDSETLAALPIKVVGGDAELSISQGANYP